ncbi:MAG: polyprenyl synthetase [Halobacteriales archaeon]
MASQDGPVERSAIEAALRRALDDLVDGQLDVARKAVEATDDRWYGQLAAASYAATADESDAEAVLSAATATELLRAHSHLRSRLLVQLRGERAHALTFEPSEALLAGDRLSTAACASLDADAHPAPEVGFAVLANAREAVTGTFADAYVGSGDPTPGQPSFFDGTGGTIGRGAAVLGATFAGVDEARREQFAAVGRGLGTATLIGRVLDREPQEGMVAPPAFDESRLRDHAERRRKEGRQALADLSSRVDVEPIRQLDEGGRT